MTTNEYLQADLKAVDQFRAIRNQFYLKMRQSQLKTLLISSPIDGIGKTTVAINLAASFAANGTKALLVDANFTRPMLADAFGLQTPGLAEALDGKQAVIDLVQSTDIANLDVLTTGAAPEDASAVFVSQAFEAALAQLKQQYDIVIFDGDTILDHADVEALALLCDFTVLVVAHKTVKRESFADVQATLAKLDDVEYGVVYNQAPAKRTDFDF